VHDRDVAPDERGVGIEIYCFTTTTVWAEYEAIQADIFDHLLAVVPRFGLRGFQAPTGADIRALAAPGDGGARAPGEMGAPVTPA